MKAKNQRLTLMLFALAAAALAVLLAIWGLRDRAAFFRSPGDLAAAAPPPGEAFRLGGMVEKGSLRRAADGVTIDFIVGDDSAARVRVRYRGIVPDLFREGSGVIAEGRLVGNGLFVADEILAKHDETYKPPEPARHDGTAEHKSESLR
ncbi:MAG: cytochrome c maturation protein CcmE [Allosphingosinicella sp.]